MSSKKGSLVPTRIITFDCSCGCAQTFHAHQLPAMLEFIKMHLPVTDLDSIKWRVRVDNERAESGKIGLDALDLFNVPARKSHSETSRNIDSKGPQIRPPKTMAL